MFLSPLFDVQASAFTLRPLQTRSVNGHSTVNRGAETFSLARPAHSLGREMHASRHTCTGRAHRSQFARASPPAELLLSDSASRRSLVISTRHTRKPTSPGIAPRAALAGPATTAPWPAPPRRTARLPAPTRPHTGPSPAWRPRGGGAFCVESGRSRLGQAQSGQTTHVIIVRGQ